MKKRERKTEKQRSGEARQRRWRSLQLKFMLFITAVLMAAGVITVLLYYLLLRLLDKTPVVTVLKLNPVVAGVAVLCVCGAIAALLFAWLSNVYLHPMKQLIRATKEVRRGNFKVRVHHRELHPVTEMQELVENFNKMVGELEGIELFRNDFINSFSHEFKTPIVSIRGFARELLRDGVTEAQQQEYIRIIESESDRLAGLATNILELSRLENQELVTDSTCFYLDEQLRRSLLLFESEWMEKELEIRPELVELRYRCNEELLALVWNNLISNAVKFTPHGGCVSVTMSVTNTNVTVEIQDTGIGMDAETVEHIFDKFYQGDSSHHNRGYGIGLALVKRAVCLCGGSITVESTLGVGSTFRVVLPIGE